VRLMASQTNCIYVPPHQVRDFLCGRKVFTTSVLADSPANPISAGPQTTNQRSPFVLLCQRSGDRTRAEDYQSFIKDWKDDVIGAADVKLPEGQSLVRAITTDNSKTLRSGMACRLKQRT
jgi:hypothetical protein